MLTLGCHNMEIKTIIGNRGFLIYKKYRCRFMGRVKQEDIKSMHTEKNL